MNRTVNLAFPYRRLVMLDAHLAMLKSFMSMPLLMNQHAIIATKVYISFQEEPNLLSSSVSI